MDAERALRGRGVVAARQLAQTAAPDLIGAWCEYSDRQRRMGREMGPGALVYAIRSGIAPPPVPGTRRGDSYLNELAAWVAQHFPDLAGHPAAISAVWKLDWRHGQARRDAGAYEAQIRAAVAASESR